MPRKSKRTPEVAEKTTKNTTKKANKEKEEEKSYVVWVQRLTCNIDNHNSKRNEKMAKLKAEKALQMKEEEEEMKKPLKSKIKKPENNGLPKRKMKNVLAEDYIEPNDNKSRPVRMAEDPSNETPEQRKERKYFNVFVENRLLEMREKYPYSSTAHLNRMLFRDFMTINTRKHVRMPDLVR